MDIQSIPEGHIITGKHIAGKLGDCFLEITSERYQQKVRLDVDTSTTPNEQILEWLTLRGHNPIARADTDSNYIFICQPFKPLS
jgi:hypothetical protein